MVNYIEQSELSNTGFYLDGQQYLTGLKFNHSYCW
jgi:hypothetical protein